MPDASQFTSYARILRLAPVESATVVLPPIEQPGEPQRPVKRWRAGGIISFLLLVALPTLLVGAYFYVFAADRYQSETRFVLRVPGRTMANAAMANLVPSTGIMRSNDDGYVVQEFLQSRDALAWLERRTGLRHAYDAAAARNDFLWRFPNIWESNTEEGLFRYYRRMMSANFDSTSGVTTLKAQAFSPAEAQLLTVALLEAAESLVNRLNERARRDAITIAEAEADRMRQRAVAAQAALTKFREQEQLIDPSQATLAVLEAVGKLAHDAAQVNVQLNELATNSPNAPQIASLRARRAALEAQIAIERRRLAGDAQSIAPRIVEYERLMLEREFAEKALMVAMTAVETARADAQRQQVYLERVEMPARPDYPAYPWRALWCIAVAMGGYIGWRIWRILVGDAMQHVER